VADIWYCPNVFCPYRIKEKEAYYTETPGLCPHCSTPLTEEKGEPLIQCPVCKHLMEPIATQSYLNEWVEAYVCPWCHTTYYNLERIWLSLWKSAFGGE